MVRLLSVMSAGDAWIGGTDEGHEGTWVWLFGDDTFTYSNWNSGKNKRDFFWFHHVISTDKYKYQGKQSSQVVSDRILQVFNNKLSVLNELYIHVFRISLQAGLIFQALGG